MTNKSSEWTSKKEKKNTVSSPLDNSSHKKKAGHANPKTPPMLVEPVLPKPAKPLKADSPKESVGLFDAEKEKQKVKTKSRVRSFISLSFVAYLSYNAFYACGSPFESGDKPAICNGIDPIKLDIYSIYQSNFYKTNADPYISSLIEKGTDIYFKYGIPIQYKIENFYSEYGKPHLDQRCIQAHEIYKHQIEPVYTEKVASVIGPLLIQAKPYYTTKLETLLDQSAKKISEVRVIIQDKLNELYPVILQFKDVSQEKITHWSQRAETELIPVLENLYWTIIDFIQFQILPVVKDSHVVTGLDSYYNKNMKHYVDFIVKPVLAPLQLDKLFRCIHAHLPTRSELITEQVSAATTASTQLKTASAVVPKTKDIPITPPAASAKTVTVTKKQSAPASVVTGYQKPEATVGKYVNNNDDIIQDKSVKPTVETDESYIPDANKKEAIYVPTCNSAEEQLIVANTDKHLVAVPTDKDLFEVHKQQIHVQSTSGNKEYVNEQFVIQAPIQNIEKASPSIAEENIVFSIQTEIPIASVEEVAFKIQTVSDEDNIPIDEEEAPTPSEEDIVFNIQTEVPMHATSQEDIFASIQQESIAAVDEEIIADIKAESIAAVEVEEEIAAKVQTAAAGAQTAAAGVQTPAIIEAQTSAAKDVAASVQAEVNMAKRDDPKEVANEVNDVKQDNIFVPPAIQNEELVLDSSKGSEEEEPMFVKVEEPAQETEKVDYKEPVVNVEQVEVPSVNVKVPAIKDKKPSVKAPLTKEPIEPIGNAQE